jgi:phosphoglycerol transferase MdoB-like AlkP superfamily enzyme
MKWWKQYAIRYAVFAKTLLAMLCLLMGLRVVFNYYNQPFFNVTAADIVGVYVWGLRLDLAAVAIANIPVLLLYVGLSLKQNLPSFWLLLCRMVFVLMNALLVAVNIIDIGYFKYTKHRANAELFYIFSDSLGSLPSLVLTFTALFLLFAVIVFGLIRWSKNIVIHAVSGKRWLIELLCIVILVVASIRGWGEKTLMPTSPLLSINHENLPLSQNSFHHFIYSLLKKQNRVQPKNYLTQQQADSIVTTQYFINNSPDSFSKKNVVICVLESFSRCYTEPSHPQKAVTPFFDSLIQYHCTNFPNAYGNAYTSAQGIVNILGSMYTFIDEPYFYSAYNNTKFETIGSIFKQKGYNTNFFLGAGEDHFGFSKWAKMVGVDSHYNRITYNNENDYDGNWGIFDAPFFQYAATVHNNKPQPFFSVLYNISSHPPFTIPASLKKQFQYAHQSPAQNAISYVDYSFKQFFETAKTMPWYNNTVFVFVADHWFSPTDKTPYSYTNSSAVPIFIFDPAQNTAVSIPTLASQVDVVPTILDWLQYSGTYTGFGKSLLRKPSNQPYVLSYTGQVVQIITDDYVLGYNEQQEKTVYLYQYKTDSTFKNNLHQQVAFQSIKKNMEMLLKANLQQYNAALLRRSLYTTNK